MHAKWKTRIDQFLEVLLFRKPVSDEGHFEIFQENKGKRQKISPVTQSSKLRRFRQRNSGSQMQVEDSRVSV